jgi:hypothetical protein
MSSANKSISRHKHRKYCGKKIAIGLRKSRGNICSKNLRKESRRKWEKKNPEKVKEYRRRWREKNLEKLKEYRRKLRKKHPEKVREYQRKWIEKRKKLKEIARRKKL